MKHYETRILLYWTEGQLARGWTDSDHDSDDPMGLAEEAKARMLRMRAAGQMPTQAEGLKWTEVEHGAVQVYGDGMGHHETPVAEVGLF